MTKTLAPFRSQMGRKSFEFTQLKNWNFSINTPKYAAGVFPICLKTGRLLLCKRGPKLDKEPNKWANLGGKSNPYETAYETAVREFYEESGRIMPVKLIPSYIDENEDGFKFYNFIGLVEEEFNPIIGKLTVDFEIEITHFRWMTLNEFFDFDGNQLHWGVKKFRSKAKCQLKKLFELKK